MRGTRCSICSHPARQAIEKQLAERASMELLAERYATTNDMLRLHRDHMGRELVPAEPQVVPNAPPSQHGRLPPSQMDAAAVFHEHDECIREAKDLILFARELGETKGWALGVREWRGCLDQKAKILGLYDQVDPRLQRAFAARLIEVVSHALETFPDAKQKVLAAIDEVEKGDG